MSVSAFKLLLLLPVLLSVRVGIAVVEIDRDGSANEFGLLPLLGVEIVPMRGRRPP